MKSKKLVCLFSTLVMASAPLMIGGSSVYASQIQEEKTTSEVNEIVLEKLNDSEFITEALAYADSIGIKKVNDTIYVNDNQMANFLEYLGYDLSPYKIDNPMLRANGVTKIVTKKGSGSWDVYLSGTFLRGYYGGATILGGALTVAIGILSGGLLLAVSASIATGIANHIKGEIKHGVIVRVRNWRISSISNQ